MLSYVIHFDGASSNLTNGDHQNLSRTIKMVWSTQLSATPPLKWIWIWYKFLFLKDIERCSRILYQIFPVHRSVSCLVPFRPPDFPDLDLGDFKAGGRQKKHSLTFLVYCNFMLL